MTEAPPARIWLVCEDGSEYSERFARFFPDVRFDRISSAHALYYAAEQTVASGIILDLDFRRCPVAALIDENGHTHASLPAGEQRRLAGQQGLFILRGLRRRGCPLFVILCADLDDPERVTILERDLAPLKVASSNQGLDEFARWIRDGRGV